MIQIHLPDPATEEISDIASLTAVGEVALSLAKAPENCSLTLILTDDQELQRLNREHLGIDAPTDVLSFPVPYNDPETGTPYLGDILVSIPTAEQQAIAAGHPLADEVSLLFVHGILHLLGYDHGTPEEKAAMWQVQDEILSHLKISARPTES